MMNEELINIAKNIRKNAFAKSSGYGVGAALITKAGNVYVGVNVEDNVILSLSVCAERVAIQNAITMSEREFQSIAIVGGYLDGDKLDNTVPCGVCLQYILDICEDINVITISEGEIISKKVSDYLNKPFKLKK